MEGGSSEQAIFTNEFLILKGSGGSNRRAAGSVPCIQDGAGRAVLAPLRARAMLKMHGFPRKYALVISPWFGMVGMTKDPGKKAPIFHPSINHLIL